MLRHGEAVTPHLCVAGPPSRQRKIRSRVSESEQPEAEPVVESVGCNGALRLAGRVLTPLPGGSAGTTRGSH